MAWGQALFGIDIGSFMILLLGETGVVRCYGARFQPDENHSYLNESGFSKSTRDGICPDFCIDKNKNSMVCEK